MSNSDPAQPKHTAVELIKKFQQLFTDLNHKQIAERLVKLVIAKETISRAVLIVERDSHLYVEAIASSGTTPCVNAVATSLSRLNYLPHQYIHQHHRRTPAAAHGRLKRFFAPTPGDAHQAQRPLQEFFAR